jgi:hypothetical protein
MTPINVPLTMSFDNELILSTAISLAKEIPYQKYGTGFSNDNLTEQVRWVTIFNKENHIAKIKESLGEDFSSFPLHEVLFFNLPPGKKTLVHRDVREGYVCPEFALNLPLQDSNKVLMTWYTSDVSKQKTVPINMTREEAAIYFSTKAEISTDTIIDQIYYSQPHITNILVWHDVKNESTETAYFISLRFELDFTHEQIISKFSPISELN